MQDAASKREEGPTIPAIAWVLAAAFLFLAWVVSTHLPPRGPALLAYGDSIVVAKGASTPWPGLLGAEVDAVSGRALIDDPGAAQRIAKARPVQVWIAIGTNDYGKSKATPAEFRQAYERLVDGIHAESRSTAVYAQTPLVRISEGPNKLGASLWEYRQAIVGVCAARRWLTCIDGQQILQLSDMPDGLHPGSEAQRRYAGFVDMQLYP